MSDNNMHVGQMLISGEIGGAERVVLDITKKLIENGIKTSIILNDEISGYFQNIDGLNIINIGRVYKYGLRNFYLRNAYLILYFKFNKKRIIKTLLKQHIDIIHIHLVMSIALFNEISDIFDVKSVYTIHGVVNVSNIELPNISDLVRYVFEYKLSKLSKSYFYTSACRYFIDVFDEMGLIANNYTIIPNGVNLSELNNIDEIKLEGSFKLLFLGGERYSKGGDILIKSLDTVKREIPDFRLYILRDIPESHFIKKYVKNHDLMRNVIFVGYKRPPEYYQYIKSSDVVILPSRIEGIAASLLEDMAFGKPIIATKVGGTPELIKHDINGILTSANPSDIANSIIYLYQNPDVRRKISENNLQSVKSYDWNIIIGDYIKLYNELAKSGNLHSD